MKLFQILLLIVSISIFIGLFIYTAAVFYSGDKSTIYPPDLTSCPDNWKMIVRTIDGDKRHVCQIPPPNEMNLGALKEKGMAIYKYPNIDGTGNNLSYLPKYYDFQNSNTPNLNAALPDTVVKGDPMPHLRYYSADDIPEGYGNTYNKYDMKNLENNNYIDFQAAGWASQGDPFCRIKNWAKINNIQWDGMSNYNRCSV